MTIRPETRERGVSPVSAVLADRERQKPGKSRLCPGDAKSCAQAREALSAKRAAGAHYRRDFLDAPEWDRLARAYGLRLPQWHVAPDPRKMSSWLQKLGATLTAYREHTADRTLSDFAALNPDWPLRSWVGLLLEGIAAGILPSSRYQPLQDDGPVPDEPALFTTKKDRHGDAILAKEETE